MATEVHELANGNLNKEEHVEPLGEICEPKEDAKKLEAVCNAQDGNGVDSHAEKEEPLPKAPASNKQKGVVEEDANADAEAEAQDGHDYSSEDGDGYADEDGDGDVDKGEEDLDEGDGEAYEDEENDEYVGEDDEDDDDDGEDDEEQPPPQKRRK
ncbi:hypothetical protein KP509_01G121600 [Ceratopteris richardii]|nr:hypothetical protein KP509_01G121600 [Ceratopteris richardii]